MAYLQEQALNKAVARLHILGHADNQQDPQKFGENVGGALGITLRAPFRHKTPKQAARAQSQMTPAEAAAQYGRFIEGTGARTGMAQEGNGSGVAGPEGTNGQADAQYGRYVQGSYAPVGTMQSGLGTEASSPADFLKLNNQAANIRFGGRFTPQGLDYATQQADANSNDRLQMKGLIHGAIDGQGPQQEELTAPGMAGSEVGTF